MIEIRTAGAVKFTWEQQTLIFEVVSSTDPNLEGVFTADLSLQQSPFWSQVGFTAVLWTWVGSIKCCDKKRARDYDSSRIKDLRS